jgi:2-polyprenyl-3-methyl-5-hydroxy-6-metoxy-1,4-benzoquinol methylase
MNSFDKQYWDEHWDHRVPEAGPSAGPGAEPETHVAPPNPYIATETRDLPKGRALDAGCGEGAEAVWLATDGWTVTGADISGQALATAAERARTASVADRVSWLEVDLTTWEPKDRWDLVVTNYAHSTMGQLAFYQRLATWVAPGGTLLIVGHRHDHAEGASAQHASAQHPPREATVTLAGIRDALDRAHWTIETAQEHTRALTAPDGHFVELRDVVLRATRRN